MGTDLQEGAKLVLTPMEIDAIGEVLNISMGSAATAVSSMLDKQVIITTPKVSVENVNNIDYTKLEPALVVKITYTEGISGSNVMVFSQKDMQLILNQLMGVDDPISDNFVFDDLSMSAACEIMNQMMGASATALSSFLGKSINISTPTATVMSNNQT
ncbi:MAG: chemotaxis protein CheC, partial [Angelakisella sp.]